MPSVMNRYRNGPWLDGRYCSSSSHRSTRRYSFRSRLMHRQQRWHNPEEIETSESESGRERKSEESMHFFHMLRGLDVPMDIISDVISAGYGTAIRLLRMPSDLGDTFFGNRYSQIWNTCVAYVQMFNVKLSDMQTALEDQRKFEITMGGPKWFKFLGGGFRSHEFVLLSGESGLGKTLLMLTLALRVASMGGKVYFLESDDKVDVVRVEELCFNLNFGKGTLQNIMHISSFSHGEQLATLRHVQHVISDSNVGSLHLVVVDSLTGALRRELPGLANISRRQAVISRCIDSMKKMASDNAREVIVAATTDVATAYHRSNSNVDGFTPLGGCVLQHSASTRIFLSCDQLNDNCQKIMTLQTSMHAPPSRIRYKICEKGIVLVDEVDDKIKKQEENTQDRSPSCSKIKLQADILC